MLLIHLILRRLLGLFALLAAFAEDCAREKPPPKYDRSAAAPLDYAELGLLPDELIEEIIKHLLPENGLQDKPVDAIRFGSTCRHLRDLVSPLAFQTLVIRDSARSTAWLADYLQIRGHHVRRLAVTMLSRGPNDAALISTCIKRCRNRYEVKLRSLSAKSHGDPVFAVFSAIPHPGPRFFQSDRLSGVAPLRNLELNLSDVPLRSLRDFLELFAGTLSTCRITLAYSNTNALSHLDDDMPSVILPLCTHLCLDAESAAALFSSVFDPATPLRTIEYQTARDNGMTQTIKWFHRRQRVKTLELVRYQRHRSAPILVTEYIGSRRELDQFKAWGKSVHVEVDVEDMYLKAFEVGSWP
ncbi:hypothetical protein RHOSPDRAFT_33225 [Rhodotorula sp. JG-1b]|nr:hypothetical protein RHOSPDRAFT_33225 [Rhodotorula sp. JG-1b]